MAVQVRSLVSASRYPYILQHAKYTIHIRAHGAKHHGEHIKSFNFVCFPNEYQSPIHPVEPHLVFSKTQKKKSEKRTPVHAIR
jgi:hypothetical protein